MNAKTNSSSEAAFEKSIKRVAHLLLQPRFSPNLQLSGVKFNNIPISGSNNVKTILKKLEKTQTFQLVHRVSRLKLQRQGFPQLWSHRLKPCTRTSQQIQNLSQYRKLGV
ncbi:hypothetical protein GOODEAATRI_003115 [Goodea atripinnis]|uniref:Uncharacterized protein n=1 Tax=Goodea atripinnis TaxID=208336 RepID=A0ABV0PKD1_9TELE